MKKSEKCLNPTCRKVSEKFENVPFIDFSYNEFNGILTTTLQEEKDKWSLQTDVIEKRCCKFYDDNGHFIVNEKDRPNTSYNVLSTVFATPSIIHLKVKNRSENSSVVFITEQFTICNRSYKLQTAMRFLGRDDEGHWM